MDVVRAIIDFAGVTEDDVSCGRASLVCASSRVCFVAQFLCVLSSLKNCFRLLERLTQSVIVSQS